MNNYIQEEWRRMVKSAELSLKSTCPLLEDEVIVSVNKELNAQTDVIGCLMRRIKLLENKNEDIRI